MRLLIPTVRSSARPTSLTRWSRLVLSLLVISSGVRAQQTCLNPGGDAPGSFSLVSDRVCIGTPVLITGAPPALGSVGYNFDYDNKTPVENVALAPVLSHTYTQPGTYTIVQGGSSTIACRQVTVLPLGPVKFTTKACTGFTANLSVQLDAGSGQYDTYTVSWGDGASEAVSRPTIAAGMVHTYADRGPYSISVTGRYSGLSGCIGPATAASVTLGTADPPAITQLTTSGTNTVSIRYQTSAGTSATLYRKDAGGTYVPTNLRGDGSTPFTLAADVRQVQCFQLRPDPDACGNVAANSDEVCSLVLNAQAVNQQNRLSWQPYAGSSTPFRLYRITRDGVPIGGTISDRSVGQYTDAAGIECGQPYCYVLEAQAGPTTVTSAPVCVTGINNEPPGALGDALVSVENGHPRLIVSLPATTSGTVGSYSLVVSRADGPSGTFQPVATLSTNTFTDAGADALAGSYCYVVAYQNNCGLSSAPTRPVCTVFLKDQPPGIAWTSDSPFTSGPVIGYTLEITDTTRSNRQQKDLGTNVAYTPDPNDPGLQAQQYRIVAVAADGNLSYSNFFVFRREARLFLPDAFTPNGDGINDQLVVRGQFIDRFRFSIYDRWGQPVYSTTDQTNGWDGQINGQPAPAGQYLYRVEMQDLTGQKTVRTGAVLLVR